MFRLNFYWQNCLNLKEDFFLQFFSEFNFNALGVKNISVQDNLFIHLTNNEKMENVIYFQSIGNFPK